MSSDKQRAAVGRQLRKRAARVNYADGDAALDKLLGVSERSKERRRRTTPDVASLRRKIERSCPAVQLSPCTTHPSRALDTLLEQGFRQPVVFRSSACGSIDATRRELGITLPASVCSPAELAAAVGADHAIPTFDVFTQDSGPRMTIGQLAEYHSQAPEERTKLINVVSFSLAETSLAEEIVAPAAVRALDLATNVWPQDVTPRPDTLVYSLLGPQGAYTDWHVDMGGSSVWYHVLKGCKIFMLAPPTPHNVAAFESWSNSPRQITEFLGDTLEGRVRVALREGDTLFLPAGWPHAVSTPVDSVVVGGNFLHPLDYATLADVYRRETRLGIAPKFQFPLFRKLIWHAACDAACRLADCEKRFSPWERDGLPHLIRLLREWQADAAGSRRNDLPDEIEDPEEFIEMFERLVEVRHSNATQNVVIPRSTNRCRPKAEQPEVVDLTGDEDRKHDQPRRRASTLASVDPTVLLALISPKKRQRRLTDNSDDNRNGMRSSHMPEGLRDEEAAIDHVFSQDGEDTTSSDLDLLHSMRREPRRTDQRRKQEEILATLRRAVTARIAQQKLSDYAAPSRPNKPQRVVIDSESDSESDSDNGSNACCSEKDVNGNGEHKAGCPPSQVTKTVSQRDKQNLGNEPSTKRLVDTGKVPIKVGGMMMTTPTSHRKRVQPLMPPSVPAPRNRVAGGISGKDHQKDTQTSDLRADADIARLGKLEAALQRDQKLLQQHVEGVVALKDGGEKLQSRIKAQEAELEAAKNAATGRFFFVTALNLQPTGPFARHDLLKLVEKGELSHGSPEVPIIEHVDGRALTLSEALALPEPPIAALVRNYLEARKASTEENANYKDEEKLGLSKQRSQERNCRRGVLHEKAARDGAASRHRTFKTYPSPQEEESNVSTGRYHIEQVATMDNLRIWTYKSPNGGICGPCSVSELRSLFIYDRLKADVLVHDEEGGVTMSLGALLGANNRGLRTALKIEKGSPSELPTPVPAHRFPEIRHTESSKRYDAIEVIDLTGELEGDCEEESWQRKRGRHDRRGRGQQVQTHGKAGWNGHQGPISTQGSYDASHYEARRGSVPDIYRRQPRSFEQQNAFFETPRERPAQYEGPRGSGPLGWQSQVSTQYTRQPYQHSIMEQQREEYYGGPQPTESAEGSTHRARRNYMPPHHMRPRMAPVFSSNARYDVSPINKMAPYSQVHYQPSKRS